MRNNLDCTFFFRASQRTWACGAVGPVLVDICGSSIPKLVGLGGPDSSNTSWSPVYVENDVAAVSQTFSDN